MRLRCRTPGGLVTVGANLSPASTLRELKQEIATIVGFHPLLKAGFPPKDIVFQDDSSLLECGIRDGDQLIAEGRSEAATRADAQGRAARSGMATGHAVTGVSNVPAGSFTSAIPMDDHTAVAVADGFIVVREMADDNSCLFRSVSYLLEHTPENHSKFRDIVAQAIRQDPFNYNEAILGRNPQAYIKWILQPSSWGGAIELKIISERFQVGSSAY